MEFSSLIDNIGLGLSSALTLQNIYWCFVGVFFGTLLGVLPGIGTLVAMSLLFPLTFHLDASAGLIMLAGIYYGTSYGGSTASILLNVPGTPASAVVCLDGYQMAKQGRAGVALMIAAVGSFVGGSIGIILMMVFSPLITTVALAFGPAEYVALMVLGLVAASTMSSGSPAKGISMVVLGILLGLVGLDINSGAARFTFGSLELYNGLALVALAMGLFGAAEVITSIREASGIPAEARRVTLRSMIPTREDIARSWAPILRASGIGSFFGTLPGTGATLASFMSYSVERGLARDPSRFGKGAIEGVAGPETANNAADQTAFIPTMTLGIPGTASMALILGVLMMHNITPGPDLILNHAELFWGLIMSFWLGNLMLVVLNIPLIGIWVRLLTIPYHLIYPAVLVFVCVGIYSIESSATDVLFVAVFGALGYVMRLLDLPPAPLLLGFVLGPMLEEHFRRALLMSRGDMATFVTFPIAGPILFCTVLILIATIVVKRRRMAIPL